MNRTFGSDPELMVVRDGRCYSAIGVVNGTVENKIHHSGHDFYYDNVMAECAIRPASSKKEAIDNFRECLTIYAEMVRPYKLAAVASHVFDPADLTHPDARKAGCAPDDCAYEMVQKEPPKSIIETGNLRSGGGHIHLGSPTLLAGGPEPVLTVYMMDLLLGVTSVWIDKDPTSSQRRLLYGQAGRYRTKEKYGIEYRPLGNFWLVSPRLVGLVYDLTMRSLDLVESRKAWAFWDYDFNRFFERGVLSDVWNCTGYDAKALCEGVNTGDKKKLAPHYEIAQKLMTAGLRRDVAKAVENDPGDFYANWGLN